MRIACGYACAGGFEGPAHGGDDDVDDVHDHYYDTAWGLHEDPLVGFWLPTLQSPAGNDISRDSVEGVPAPSRRYTVRRTPRTVVACRLVQVSCRRYPPPFQHEGTLPLAAILEIGIRAPAPNDRRGHPCHPERSFGEIISSAETVISGVADGGGASAILRSLPLSRFLPQPGNRVIGVDSQFRADITSRTYVPARENTWQR